MARRASRTKVWAGRLGSETDDEVERYTSSVDVDKRLAAEDVEGSRAHARMLREVGILSAAELRAVDKGLAAIAAELKAGAFAFAASDEDIHTAVERRLHELAGTAAGKLHTGRSRNDQVVTDLRLWSRRACSELLSAVAGLQEALLARAEEHRGAVLPGYTHGQRAQVVSLAHHLLAYVEMLQRDAERLIAARRRSDVLPLGSGALAGSTLRLDRERVRAGLGFAGLTANSMDAVSDRDFAVEVVAALALLMVHLSRLSEELVLWSSAEFGFVTFPDSHATGSSLMPQKKNPDVAELARGRSARVIGDLVTLLTLLKGLPLTYNRDLQEDKPPLFDAVDTSLATLSVLAGVVAVVRFNSEAMMAAAADPSLVATDVAEYLVLRGVPFREAHTIVGRAVARGEREGRTIADLTAREWKALSKHFDADVVSLFDVRAALRRRDGRGGPGPRSVARQLTRARKLVAETRRQVTAQEGRRSG
jgi:argininosuccinate lyase